MSKIIAIVLTVVLYTPDDNGITGFQAVKVADPKRSQVALEYACHDKGHRLVEKMYRQGKAATYSCQTFELPGGHV